MFDFDKAYWIPLSAHTVLIGATTVHSFERAGSRSIGTIIGVLILSLILLVHRYPCRYHLIDISCWGN